MKLHLEPGRYRWLTRGIFARGTKHGTVYGISYKVRGHRKLEVVGPTLTLAKKALEVRKGEIAKGKFNLASTRKLPRLPAFAQRYMEDYSRPNKRSSARDETVVGHLTAFLGHLRLDEVTAWQIERYRARRLEHGRTVATVNRELALLKHMLGMAVRWGYLTSNPADEVKLARVEEKPFRVLSHDEEGRLLASCADHLQPIVVLALHTGLRRGELLALEWRDVDLRARQLTVRRSKSGRVRTIPLNAPALAAIGNATPDGGPVFRYEGKPIGTVASAFRAAVRRAGLPHIRFHDLRHTFITRLVLAGVDLATVRELAGHASFAMTIRYAHPTPEHRREAVARLASGATKVQRARVPVRRKDRPS